MPVFLTPPTVRSEHATDLRDEPLLPVNNGKFGDTTGRLFHATNRAATAARGRKTAMERKHQVASAVRRALIMGALTAAGAAPALAQENLGEIVVTGSRIRSANLESTSPVTQVTAADVVTQGVTRIEDLVNQLPQAFAAQNVTLSNGATGTATLNLRGLGSPRTLVLIDGRRMPYGGVTSASAAPDMQPDSDVDDRAGRHPHGRRVCGLRLGCRGRRRQLRDEEGLRGREVTSQYNFYWHENDYSGPGETKFRDVIAGRAATNPSQFALPADSVTDGEGKELTLTVGVNSGDGRGNITAYATVFAQRSRAAGGPRLFGVHTGSRARRRASPAAVQRPMPAARSRTFLPVTDPALLRADS